MQERGLKFWRATIMSGWQYMDEIGEIQIT
jgi:hypothetical protein